VVDDDRQVALARAVRYLVDPDAAQAGEQIDLRWASEATRSQIPPTLRQAIRINSATAAFDVLTANHATWSSEAW
jgi:hypothetical protein